MKIKEEKTPTSSLKDSDKIQNEIEISDPLVLPVLFHEQKRKIIDLLMENEYTLKDLRDKLKMHAGSIKRFLDELRELGIIKLTRTEISPYGIIMKYYRSTAKKFKIKIEFEIPNRKEKA